jgi:hypothetical protein
MHFGVNPPIIPPIVHAPKYLSELGSIFPSGYLFSCVAIAIVCECVSVCLSIRLLSVPQHSSLRSEKQSKAK